MFLMGEWQVSTSRAFSEREVWSPDQVGIHSTHCNLIQPRCNAIQTLLQLNSNNSKNCVIFFYTALCGILRSSAELCGIWRVISRPNSTKFDLVCAELIFSAAGADACNSLILREPLGLVAQFQRTFSWDPEKNPVSYFVSIA